MSAICAYYRWGNGQDPESAVRQMLVRQKAYGPDDLAASSFGDLALGRALFKLLPEDDEDRQPIVSPDGGLALVADIRIDNREELLASLGEFLPRPGTRSDAGLLLACLMKWGEDGLLRILGDYAFLLWNRRSRRLLLGRDPLGQRPLYYHCGSGFAAAATMPKGLHALENVARRADPEWLTDFLGFVPLRGPRSQYESLSRVQAGELVTIAATGIDRRRFWHPQPPDDHIRDLGTLREAMRAELDRAVRARLRRRAGAVASHLSGGWDSGAVAGTAASALSSRAEKLFAFTSVPRVGSIAPAVGQTLADEGALAAEAASLHPNLRHLLVPGTGESPIADLDRLIEVYDRPLATLCNNVWLSDIRDLAREHGVSVLLTGEVGNWTISGGSYALLGEYLRQGRWSAWPREAAAVARKRNARLRGIIASSVGPWVPRRLLEIAAPFSSGINTAVYNAAHPRLAQTIAKRRQRFFGSLPRSHFGRTFEALANRDFGDYRKGGLAGWGIDERDPTADRRLAEFCLSLPLEMLLKNGERRPLAKAALADRVPRLVLEQKNKGYQGADWHEGLTAARTAISNLLEEIAADDMAASLLDLDAMRQWVRDWPEGGWHDARVTARYRNALLVGLSAGHFALRANA
ncbi:MAG TPA: asparagine synthase-related protein [Allosphingosinicella sp.]|jgi:asparagine synthase (glutamine-hydrolysing)